MRNTAVCYSRQRGIVRHGIRLALAAAIYTRVNALQALVHVLGFGVSRQSSSRQFLMQEFANTETVENPNVLTYVYYVRLLVTNAYGLSAQFHYCNNESGTKVTEITESASKRTSEGELDTSTRQDSTNLDDVFVSSPDSASASRIFSTG
ncbi:hypothetical protein HZH68_016174 [Vespula germanica]|uniref:Uncharacterized protein n=1 Tax=Vespula germanica TaxID=30212 RepID=A0A834J6F0_VESGE|nr:hypothetical protein HZH68_016174 [Vespula germanica]